MSETTAEQRRLPLPDPGGWLDLLVRTYGPYVFGVVSLLMIWVWIVGPFIEHNRIDTQAIENVTVALQETARAQEKTAATLNATAVTLNATAAQVASAADTLAKSLDKLERMNGSSK